MTFPCSASWRKASRVGWTFIGVTRKPLGHACARQSLCNPRDLDCVPYKCKKTVPIAMNPSKTLAGIAVIVLIALAIYQARQTTDLKQSVAALSRDRDNLNRQVKDLSRQVSIPSADRNRVQAPQADAP